MHRIRKLLAIAAVGAMGLVSIKPADAAASVIVVASSGHPYQSFSWSNYTTTDGNVYFSSSRGWTLPLPLPTMSFDQDWGVGGNWWNTQSVSAWVIDLNGEVVGGTPLVATKATKVTAIGGSSIFIRAMAKATEQARVYNGWATAW